jgi:FAD/FMN-containing dehydrogenase
VLLTDDVLLPNTTLYDTSTRSYFFRDSRENPRCVVAATSSEDVAQAIKIMTAQPSVNFSVKRGGHSPNEGASNTNDGVTIDLGGMKSISPLEGKWDIISIGAGAKAIDAYRVLDPHNRTVIGRRVASIGFGGF